MAAVAGEKYAGPNLAVTIGGTAVVCPQSFSFTPTDQFVEYNCPGAAGVQRQWTARSWAASLAYLPNNNSHDILGFFNATPGVTKEVIVYPDGNTSGLTKVTANCYVAVGMELGSYGAVGSAPVSLVVDGEPTFANATGS